MNKLIKVLIVDDEEVVVQGIKKGLEDESNEFVVKTALGGEPAIEMVAKEFFDVVIVDLVMLGINGVETCKGIKKVSPKTEVLLLSGFPTEVERLMVPFLEAGGKDLYLRKPLLAKEVAEAIKKVLSGSIVSQSE